MARDGSIFFGGLRLNRSGHLTEPGDLRRCRNMLADTGALRSRPGLSIAFSPNPADTDYWQRGLAVFQAEDMSVNLAIGQRLTSSEIGAPIITRPPVLYWGLEFDGESDYVEVGNVPSSPVKTITATAWVKTTTISLQNVLRGSGAMAYPSVFDGQVRWYDGNDWRSSISFVNDGEWHHVAYRFDNGEFTIFVNGDIEYQGSEGTYTDGHVYRIGAYSTSGERAFNGLISNVRIYNRALNASEITALNTGENITDGLVGHWPMNEGFGNKAYDNSVNNNHGALMGAPEWIQLPAPLQR